ncbi:hypothetical protein ACMFMG_008671 [Clarireedia jacksonii]
MDIIARYYHIYAFSSPWNSLLPLLCLRIPLTPRIFFNLFIMSYNKAISMTDSQSETEKDEESLLGHSRLSASPSEFFGLKWRTKRGEYIKGSQFKPSKLAVLSTIAKMLGVAILFALAMYGLYSISQAAYRAYRSHVMVREARCECKGNTPEESIANGCMFDGLAMIWLPSQCRDDEISAEFATMGDGPGGSWKYYDDPELTIELPLGEVMMRAWERTPGTSVYMQTRWHITHCIMSWRREHRSYIDGKHLDPFAQGEGHIKHCGMKILHPAAKSKVDW